MILKNWLNLDYEYTVKLEIEEIVLVDFKQLKNIILYNHWIEINNFEAAGEL